jgi:hypothetical protein
MAKSDSERYELTDAEKRDIIRLIEQGKPLPEKYRFLLFDNRQPHLPESRALHHRRQDGGHFRKRHHDARAGDGGIMLKALQSQNTPLRWRG